MATKICLLRHGETEWNIEGRERFRGRADLSLNERGRRQAEALGRRLRGFGVEAIYTSPLRRARMTAEIVGKILEVPVEIYPPLVDVDYGEWEGLTPEEAAARYPDLYELWISSPEKVRFPGGESVEEACERAFRGVEELVERHREGIFAIVTHLLLCRGLICRFMGLPLSSLWQIEQRNCALNLIEIRPDRPIVALVNDTCHLRDI